MATKKKTSKSTKSTVTKHTGTHPKAHLITWIVVGALVIGIVGGYMIAKTKYTHYISEISVMFSQKDSQLNEIKSKMKEMNGVLREGGKMMMVTDGKVKVLKDEVTLSDGTVVMPNGKYTRPSGDSMTMKNGQMMNMEGKMLEGDEENPSF